MSEPVNGKRYAAVPGRIPGTPLNLSGVEFLMPPLNLDQVQQFEAIIPTLGQKPTLRENIEEALPVLHAALSRNYPDLTVEELRALIDLGNFGPACEALTSSSGFVKGPAGELQPASP